MLCIPTKPPSIAKSSAVSILLAHWDVPIRTLRFNPENSMADAPVRKQPETLRLRDIARPR